LFCFLLYPLFEFLEHLLRYVVFVIVCIVFHSFCFLFGSSGIECIVVRWYL
jgi:hypothetical protein